MFSGTCMIVFLDIFFCLAEVCWSLLCLCRPFCNFDTVNVWLSELSRVCATCPSVTSEVGGPLIGNPLSCGHFFAKLDTSAA